MRSYNIKLNTFKISSWILFVNRNILSLLTLHIVKSSILQIYYQILRILFLFYFIIESYSMYFVICNYNTLIFYIRLIIYLLFIIVINCIVIVYNILLNKIKKSNYL